MKLSVFKNQLASVEGLHFIKEDGSQVATHFHVTEVGEITKNFIDCGGTVRKEQVVNFQLWEANDVDHLLEPTKLLKIITLSEEVLGIGDWEIEVEYQAQTIGKFGLDFDGMNFVLTNKKTACLAEDQCGIPASKPKLNLKDLVLPSASTGCCTPGGGCC